MNFISSVQSNSLNKGDSNKPLEIDAFQHNILMGI